MQFDILCEQIEEITISLKKVHVKLNYLVSNLACFRLKFLYERNCNETLFTLPVASKINQKDNKTEYFWKASIEDKDTLKINKVILNVNELFCSNLEIIIYETNFSSEGNSRPDTVIPFTLCSRILHSRLSSKVPLTLSTSCRTRDPIPLTMMTKSYPCLSIYRIFA